jgi:hypothetical protein
MRAMLVKGGTMNTKIRKFNHRQLWAPSPGAVEPYVDPASLTVGDWIVMDDGSERPYHSKWHFKHDVQCGPHRYHPMVYDDSNLISDIDPARVVNVDKRGYLFTRTPHGHYAPTINVYAPDGTRVGRDVYGPYPWSPNQKYANEPYGVWPEGEDV